MWIASKFGYFSIVKKRDGYHVRARKQSDLDSLLEGLTNEEVKVWDKADYRFRIVTKDKDLVMSIFEKLGESIDYDNFKNSLLKTSQSDKLSFYHRIWNIMWEYQESYERFL